MKVGQIRCHLPLANGFKGRYYIKISMLDQGGIHRYF